MFNFFLDFKVSNFRGGRNPVVVRTRIRREIRRGAVPQHRYCRLPDRIRRHSADGCRIRVLYCQCYRDRIFPERGTYLACNNLLIGPRSCLPRAVVPHHAPCRRHPGNLARPPRIRSIDFHFDCRYPHNQTKNAIICYNSLYLSH